MPLAKPGAGPWVSTASPAGAKAFYGTIVAATLVGALMNFTPIDPIRALVVAAVINGVVSVPVMAVMMLVSTRKSAMGVFTLNRPLIWMGWIATAVMAAAVLAMRGATSLAGGPFVLNRQSC